MHRALDAIPMGILPIDDCVVCFENQYSTGLEVVRSNFYRYMEQTPENPKSADCCAGS